MKLRPKRLRRWWLRRQLIKLGWTPEQAHPMAVIVDSLDVPPSIIGGPAGVNHWSYWQR